MYCRHKMIYHRFSLAVGNWTGLEKHSPSLQNEDEDDDDRVHDDGLIDDDDYQNGGIWNDVIEEVEEEEEEEDVHSVDGSGGCVGQDQGYFQEFDLEAVEKSIRIQSRQRFQRETTAATPSRYFDDNHVQDDSSKDRQSQMRPSVSVKNIAKLFESSTKPEETGTRFQTTLYTKKLSTSIRSLFSKKYSGRLKKQIFLFIKFILESSNRKDSGSKNVGFNLSKSSWKSMPNLGDDQSEDVEESNNIKSKEFHQTGC